MTSTASTNAPSSSGVSHLRNASVPLLQLREKACHLLSEIFPSSGPVALVLAAPLLGPLGLVAQVSFLKSKGVNNIYRLEEDSPLLAYPKETQTIVYICRPEPQLMPALARQIQGTQTETELTHIEHHCYFVPRPSLACERRLTLLGVYGDLTCLSPLDLTLFPYDDDIITMDLPFSWKQLQVDNDPLGVVYQFASALVQLQNRFGMGTTISGKGDWSRKIARLTLRMQKEQRIELQDRNPSTGTSSGLIDSLILLDRGVDLVTPLMTQSTYEGLIDEVLGITNGYVQVDKKVVGKKGTGQEKTALNSNDALYQKLRDCSFSVLGPRLKQRAAFIQQAYEERHRAETPAQLKEFVKKFQSLLPEHNALQLHIHLAEQISKVTKTAPFHRRVHMEQSVLLGYDNPDDYIEELMGKQEKLPSLVRYLGLVNVVQNGFKSRKFNALRRELIQTYGLKQLRTLENLTKAQLLSEQITRSNWRLLNKTFDLMQDPEQINITDPTSINYVYSGYAPLSVRLIEAVRKAGWTRFEEVLGYLPGSLFEYRQELPVISPRAAASLAAAQDSTKKKVILVGFVGGCTYSEIAALRYLSDHDPEREYLVLTTELLNGNQFIQSMIQPLSSHIQPEQSLP